ncbi:methylated-DNA--[protein]-cysteine S-methyltransferase [Methanosalsum natronophilum]|uniref:methylated-DNA--[protein]-cysteine S-methyltransferase n=1 Tax=Methanosalsum natronophilum TaxID=768733 RepID=UPI002166D0D2|nr:MGMT family protein [Methanosalsum natronophilum]MCS3924013.1 methylated-DNA-[protein]-cysteine S-methyltransferase [Methanosalsum natronophilum]
MIEYNKKIIYELEKYFTGEYIDFLEYNVDLSTLTHFQQKVLSEVRKVPYGTTITYKELACLVGNGKSYRAVGTALSKNPAPVIIPCHRVISQTNFGGYFGKKNEFNLHFKQKLLRLENII